MTMQELMKEGRKGVQEIDGTLNRAEKVVEDTLQIGQQVRSKGACSGLQDGHAGMAEADLGSISPCNGWGVHRLKKAGHCVRLSGQQQLQLQMPAVVGQSAPQTSKSTA